MEQSLEQLLELIKVKYPQLVTEIEELINKHKNDPVTPDDGGSDRPPTPPPIG